MINSREKVKYLVENKKTVSIPLYDSFWEDTLIKWEEQGIKAKISKSDLIYSDNKLNMNLSLNNHFKFDFNMIFLDNSLRMPSKLIKKENGKITVQDRCGYTADKFIGKSRTLHMYNHVTLNKKVWNNLKARLVVDFDKLSRIDDKSLFMSYKPNITWEQSIDNTNKIYKKNKYTLISSYGPFEASWRHRGFTELLMDTATDEKFIEEMFEFHTDLIIETLKKGLSMGLKVDGYYLIEDLGYTGGLLFSKEVYKRTLHKQHKKLGDFLHKKSIQFFMHSCGKIKELIPLFIDEGLDVIQAIEAKADQDVAKLSKIYGKDLCFMGNIDVLKLLGSKEDIKREIYNKIIPAIKNGGYIYHSDHSIPPEVSLENYIHTMKLIKEIF